MCRKNHREISSLFADIKNVEILKKSPMLYNGVFRCHGNMLCYSIYVFCNVPIIGPINVRTNFEINRYKLTNLENMQKIAGFI